MNSPIHTTGTVEAQSQSCAYKYKISQTGKKINRGQATSQTPPARIANGVNKTARQSNAHKAPKDGQGVLVCSFIKTQEILLYEFRRILLFSQLPFLLFNFTG